MRRFKNSRAKAKEIMRIFNSGEKLTVREIRERLEKRGYKIEDRHLRMFIYYNMLFKYLRREKQRGVTYYYPL